MKQLIFIVCCLAIYASAELPANIPDQKVRDSVEYVDGKANKAYSVTRQFESATSTVSVSGWIGMGWERKTKACGSVLDCSDTCSTGKKVISCGCGGALTSEFLTSGYPSADNACYCAWSGAGGAKEVRTICARIN